MPSATPTAFERYQPWRMWVEVGFFVAILLSNAIGNTITSWVDLNREEPGSVPMWQPAVWEGSSAIIWMLIIPLLASFVWRWPTHWDNWRQRLLVHLAASVVVCLMHVLGMVALRILAYRTQGMDYDFGSWLDELGYEYLKDVRSYASIVLIVEFYRLLLRRMQGEASFLGPPDEGVPLEPLDRPERFLVRKIGREFLVAANDIEWLQASGNYVNLRVRGHDYPLRSTIGGIELKLDPDRFVRIHRSYIANIDQIASIEPLDTGDARVHMKDGAKLPCSRTYRSGLKQRVSAEP